MHGVSGTGCGGPSLWVSHNMPQLLGASSDTGSCGQEETASNP
jgi:hypothetical protein